MTRPRLLGLWIAVVALAFAACGHHGSTPTPVATVTPVPTASAASAPPCDISLGLAYEPDAGNGGTFHGVQYTHFEDNDRDLCASADVPTTPTVVAFSSSVGVIGFASESTTAATDAIALLQNTSGGYTLAQDIFGASIGNLTPVGAPYDLTIEPTPVPTSTATAAGATTRPTSTPVNAPLLSDASSIAILGDGSAGVALVLGTPATASTPGIVALTSLTNAPPQYGNAIPFSGSTYTLTTIPNYPRNIVHVSPFTTSGTSIALVRGPDDLLAFGISEVATGFQFNAKADDTTLGTGSMLRGSGQIAFDPADTGRALIGGTTAGGTSTLTLVTGLPTAITKSTPLVLPGNIRSIAITNAGVYAVVGTDVGIFSISGVNTGTLAVVTPFAVSPLSSTASAPTYTTCTGASAQLTNIASIGVSADQLYVVALGTGSGVACPSGYNDAIVAVPYNPATGGTPSPAPTSTASASPAPRIFVQNNVVAPPTGADLLYVH